MLRYSLFEFNDNDDVEDDEDEEEEEEENAATAAVNNEQTEGGEIEDIYNTNNSLNIDDADEDVHDDDESVS
jgi:hypothetical protein